MLSSLEQVLVWIGWCGLDYSTTPMTPSHGGDLTAWSDMRREEPCVYVRWDWDTTLARLRPLLSTTELLVPPVLPELVLLVRMRPGWRQTHETDECMSHFSVSAN